MKIKYFASICLMIFYGKLLYAAGGNYSIATIPPQLLENANAIIRVHETTFTVKSIGEATQKVHYTITILNEKAKRHATLGVPYSKLIKFNSLQGTLYDASGKEIKKLKKSDIGDVSAISDVSLFEDTRMKIASFTYTQYPYTVEFEYEVTSYNMLFYPHWEPQDKEHEAVEKSSFKVIMPQGIDLRYRELNLDKKATIVNTGTQTIYEWSVSNLPAKKLEPLSPPLSAFVPSVYTAPTDFEVEGYKGNMSSWENLGKFQQALNAGRDELPEPMKLKIQQLTAGEKDQIQKVKKVYEYLQANTRYVSIQLGIGGWQPFEAKLVAEKGYGDCKALSNYTKAMLKSIGIESYDASILAGQDEADIFADFPNSRFNHVILCVPLQKDTIWLECTSQTKAFGYMGSFTDDRYALLTTPQGGKLVRTPVYIASDNLLNRRADVHLNAQGDATAQVTTTYTGRQQETIAQVIHQFSPEDQKKWLYKNTNIPSFEINKFEFQEQKNRIPAITEKLNLAVRKCASISGSRLFLMPNLLSSNSYVPPKVENRQQEVVRNYAYIDIDTIQYHIPVNYHIEYQPKSVQIKSVFGEYTASCKMENGVITYIRSVKMNKGKYPSASYEELIEFYKKIAKADRMQLVFVNKS